VPRLLQYDDIIHYGLGVVNLGEAGAVSEASGRRKTPGDPGGFVLVLNAGFS
jgi:hypothetical protein